ncbi:sensor histidine kinase [Runella sp.]|uniref:sensor histidine kinase n=1 Tax=Runella sp. TaxID=1960881 RepID=UPI003D14C11C
MPRQRKILLHVLFWAIYFLTTNLKDVAEHSNMSFTWSSVMRELLHPLGISHYLRTFFTTYLCLFSLNWTFNQRRYGLGIILILLIYILHTLIRFGVEEVILPQTIGVRNYRVDIPPLYYFTDNLRNSLLPVLISFVFKAIDEFFIRQQVTQEKQAAELAFLKSQINPHFLFNTLNNIYSLVYKKADTAPDAVMKLSEMMRYMLYESNEEKVDLNKEIKYLQNFTALQRLRYHGPQFIDFDILGQVEGLRIAPLLLIAFVENAFKHGEVSDAQFPLSIVIMVNQQNLHLEVRNRKSRQNKAEEGGIGLQNVKRRLDLLYKDRYSLDIEDALDHYRCELNLML